MLVFSTVVHWLASPLDSRVSGKPIYLHHNLALLSQSILDMPVQVWLRDLVWSHTTGANLPDRRLIPASV
jgi:hypothetical protein